jgi:hypothetical protein
VRLFQTLAVSAIRLVAGPLTMLAAHTKSASRPAVCVSVCGARRRKEKKQNHRSAKATSVGVKQRALEFSIHHRVCLAFLPGRRRPLHARNPRVSRLAKAPPATAKAPRLARRSPTSKNTESRASFCGAPGFNLRGACAQKHFGEKKITPRVVCHFELVNFTSRSSALGDAINSEAAEKGGCRTHTRRQTGIMSARICNALCSFVIL